MSLANAARTLYARAPSAAVAVAGRVAHQSQDQLLRRILAAWWVKVLLVVNILIAIPLCVYVSASRTVAQARGPPPVGADR